jgi:hypothetical protein
MKAINIPCYIWRDKIKNFTGRYAVWGLSGQEDAVRLDDHGHVWGVYLDHGTPGEKHIGFMFHVNGFWKYEDASAPMTLEKLTGGSRVWERLADIFPHYREFGLTGEEPTCQTSPRMWDIFSGYGAGTRWVGTLYGDKGSFNYLPMGVLLSSI